MRESPCVSCGQKTPLNDSLLISGERYCSDCASAHLERLSSGARRENVSIGVDPTICAWCGEDNGRYELERVNDRPACEACANKHSSLFPGWIKLSLAGMVIAVGVCLAMGAYYHRAHSLERESQKLKAHGDNAGAGEKLANADAPESSVAAEKPELVKEPQGPDFDALKKRLKLLREQKERAKAELLAVEAQRAKEEQSAPAEGTSRTEQSTTAEAASRKVSPPPLDEAMIKRIEEIRKQREREDAEQRAKNAQKAKESPAPSSDDPFADPDDPKKTAEPQPAPKDKSEPESKPAPESDDDPFSLIPAGAVSRVA